MTTLIFFKSFKHYWSVYKQLLSFHVSLLLEYRLNALIHSIYGFTFMLGVYFGITVAFNHTDTIGGFGKSEILLMYVTSLFLWSILEATCFEGYKRFMIEDVATGQFDTLMLKPVIPQVMLAISRPHITAFIYTFVTGGLFFWLSFPFFAAATLFQILGFILLFIVGIIIHINIFSTYATLAFFMTRSSQIIRSLQSVCDQSFYPTSIYPTSIQMILFTAVPSAYAAYIPVSILLGKANQTHVLFAFVFLSCILLINKVAWKYAIRLYSSASS